MTTPTFNPQEDRLTAYALGELNEAERAEFEALLSANPEWQSEVSELQDLADKLRSDLAMESKPSLTAEQHQTLLKQAGAQPVATPASTPDVARSKRIRRWAIIGGEVAAGLVVAAGIINYTNRPAGPGLSETRSRIQGLPANESRLIVEDRNFDGEESAARPTMAGSSASSSVARGVRASSLSSTNPSEVYVANNEGKSREGLRYDEKGFDQQKQGAKFLPAFGEKGSGDKSGDRGDASAASGEGSKPFTNDKPQSRPLGGSSYRPVKGDKPADSNFNGVNEGKHNESAPAPDDQAPSNGQRRPLNGRNEATVNLKKSAPAEADEEVFAIGIKVADREARIAKEGQTSKYFRTLGESEERNGDPAKGPGTEAYEAPAENTLLTPIQQPLSTFSIDVDSASYANVRRFLTQGQLPPADAVRIEEMINYFNYDYPQPKAGEPFSVIADAAPCPWQREHYLARIALQARTIDKAKRPPTNLVFLLDVSGSMQPANKLPLVKQAMTMLCEELNERDRIAIVTYAGDAGVKLHSTLGSDQTRIMESINALQAGGSTNGAAGINLAYEEALRFFNGEGENRVILCTDGDFNVGISNDDQLVQLIQQQAKSKVFLSIFGFGMGNLKDAKLEKLADKGNGHYGYIDDLREARRVFCEELTGTLYTVAKDVKIQVEFNPLTVGAYRLIGYENRALAARDFNDDTKDAGEIGAGHTVTALYEIVPKGQWPKPKAAVDSLKYGNAAKEAAPDDEKPKTNLPPESADDLFTVKLRFKQPNADTSDRTIDYVVDDIAGKKIAPSADFLWSAAVASFGMHLKHSQFKGQWTLDDIIETAQGAKGADANGRRREFLDLVQAAKRLGVR